MGAQWFSRTYKCGNNIEIKTKFPASIDGDSTPREGTERYKRFTRRAEKNVAEAKSEVAIILNCNFTANKDFMLGLEYDNFGMEELIERAGCEVRDEIYRAAKKWMLDNFLRRCRRACKSAGVELRYLVVTSDMDGKTFEPTRVHHHMIVNAEAAEICRKKWKAGGTDLRHIKGGTYGDLSGLAEYLIAQVRQIEGEKRYTPSRGMRKPKITAARICKNPDAPLQVPKGCLYIHRAESGAGRVQRLTYWRPPKEAKRE